MSGVSCPESEKKRIQKLDSKRSSIGYVKGSSDPMADGTDYLVPVGSERESLEGPNNESIFAKGQIGFVEYCCWHFSASMELSKWICW